MGKNFKKLDRNEMIKMWSDEIVLSSNHLGQVSFDSFILGVFLPRGGTVKKIQDYVIASLGDFGGDLEIPKSELLGYMEGVQNHLLSHKYIKDQVAGEAYWGLTERGELMKELGGHRNYQEYRRREINAFKNQHYINIGLIVAATLAAVMPFFVAHFYPATVTVNVPAQSQQPARADTVLLRQLVKEYQQQKDSMPKPAINEKKRK